MWYEKSLKRCVFLILLVSMASLSASQEERYVGTERIVFKAKHEELAKLMRKLRLSNPYAKKTVPYNVWEEQAQFNVPILILTSYFLDEFCQKNQKQRLLFSARDCCHLISIYRALFPEYESIYFYCSRLAYLNPSQNYIDYVKNLYSENTVVVDGQASGNSCLSFFFNHLGTDPCYIPIVKTNNNLIAVGSFWYGVNIETLNFASHGSLYGYTKEGPQFLPLEYDIESVAPAYACIQKCIEVMDEYIFESFDQMLIDTLLMHLSQRQLTLREYNVGHAMP